VAPKFLSDAPNPQTRHLRLFSAALIPCGRFFRLAGYRPVPCEINGENGIRAWGCKIRPTSALPFLSDGWRCEILDLPRGFGSLLQKTLERRDRHRFFSVLANKLWIMGPCLSMAIGRIVWLARLGRLGWRWGKKTAGRHRVLCCRRFVIFAIGYFVQTAPWDWDNLKTDGFGVTF